MLEYNANGFRREKKFYPDGTRYQYPHPAFWEMVKGSGARVLVGSDCHNPSQVWDCLLYTSSNKVDFLLIELADIDIVATAKKLDANDVFI